VHVDYAAIAEAQRACPETQTAGITSTNLQQVQFRGTSLLCHTDTGDNYSPPSIASHTQAPRQQGD